MKLPNLIGCGAGKSGTTSLFHYLNQHPDIFMAKAKEIHYFSRHYDKSNEWYLRNFEQCGDAKIVGEFSTSYMLDPAVPERIAEMLPDARLMFILRNPIERAHSNYWFSVSIGTQERSESFSSAIRSDRGFEKYVASGFYYQYLQRFLEYFAANQIHIIITEELRASPIEEMSRCYKFLGVDSSFEPDVGKTYNVTVTATKGWKVSLVRAWTNAKKKVKPSLRWLPHFLRRELSFVEKHLAKKMFGDEKPRISESDRAYLWDIYHDHNVRLAGLIGRELSEWT